MGRIGDMEDFMKAIEKGAGTPDNAFGHQYKLLENEPSEVADFSNIFDKQGMLAILKDDKWISIYQREIACLINLYGLSKRDKRLGPLFKARRAKLFAELGITRAKEGEERKHQASLAGYRAQQGLQGYGEEGQGEGSGENQLEQLRGLLKALKRG